ncbi:MAG: hypothetical protein NT118_15220, partial [Lentisphaerae bacterium]|nr:hypothetical protein [Lentisphaerota bacterium]
MWVFTNKGFISVVRNKSKRWELLVSSRTRGQIEALLPGAHVEEKPGTDLIYCASVHQAIIAEMLAGEVRS